MIDDVDGTEPSIDVEPQAVFDAALPDDAGPVERWLTGTPMRDLPPEVEDAVRDLCRVSVQTVAATIQSLASTCVRFEQHSDFLNESIIQNPWHAAFAKGEAFGLATAAMFLGHMHNWIMLRRQHREAT